jgi:Zn-dependent protease
MPAEAVMMHPPLAMFLFFFLIEVSCWWTVLNLLPVFPLDGGQIMQGLMKSPSRVHSISLGVALAVAALALVVHLWLLCIFMGLLAVLNHKLRQESHP